MSPKSVLIDVDPSSRPRIPPVVAFPGEVVEFTVERGKASIFVPGGDRIFDELNSDVFTVESGATTSLRINEHIITNLEEKRESVERLGALFVEYAVHCTQGDKTYFAEGNSAPRIIIPRGPGG
jgi:hypothetical protein